MKKVFMLVLVAIASFTDYAQEKTISGIVTDDTGPLPGVSVLIKGTTTGTETDFDGKYTIKAHVGDILVYSFVGMAAQEKAIGKSNTMNIVLIADNVLEEVVVTAMGIRRSRRSLGYSVSNVSSSSKTKRRKRKLNNSTLGQLQGKVSGVTISSSNGAANSNKNIIIRGASTLNGNQNPLYIIDGVPFNANSKKLQKLNPNKIKDIKVLKGASATSIYGNKGANGVIVINTQVGNNENENYKEIVENQFEHVAFSPLSTFSIDVDKAAYSNIRRFINNGQIVPSDAVKIEEMINYFNYNYTQPTDEHPFSIQTEVASSPWNNQTKIVKIGLQGKKIASDKIPASNLVFLIDVSGSMSDSNKLPLLKSAFRLLVKQLRNKDKVSIVVYAGAAGVALKPTSGDDKNKILKALNNLEAGGSTAGGQGIKLAYKIAQKNFIENGNNRVILATDGDFNVGASSDKSMKELIIEKRKSGMFLTVLGFGMGNYKDSKLEILADKGNGNHAYIDTMQEAKRVLGTEFGGTLYTIAKDVKIQVEFNPKKVQAYRLIGYENRMLEDEDFKNDKKDAGELGSNHSVTALYEIIPVGIKNKFLKNIDALKYTNTKQSNDFNDELLTVKFRYKKPAKKISIEMIHIVKDKESTFDNASSDFKFATSVAIFGMKLRESKFAKKMKYDDIATIARQSKGKDTNGYRSEFIRLVEMADITN